MRLIPESAAEFGSNIPWIMEKRLEIIEEIALGSQTSGRDAPDMDEAWERMWEAVGRRDQEAEDEAFVDHTRAEVWEWWQGFSERPLLTDLYWRAGRREAKSGSLDSRRRPSHSQGVRIARALFADISDKGRLDPEQESATVAQVLAAQLLPPMGVPSRPALRDYIRRSESSLVHFDALSRIYEELDNQGKAIPRLLATWQRDVTSGRRQRPAMKPVAPHRPTIPDRLKRDIHIQFTIGLLERLGIPPYGTDVSGCRIASEALRELSDSGLVPKALGLFEDTVTRIWKGRIWKEGAFKDVMRKLPKAIAERSGLYPH